MARISGLVSDTPVDFPTDRNSRRFGLALFLFLLAWSYNKEVTLSCFTPANVTRPNAAAFDVYCHSSPLYLYPKPNSSLDRDNVSHTHDPFFRIHDFPALYHLLLLHCLTIMLPSIWYSAGARCILGNCIADLLKIMADNQPTERDLESKISYDFGVENGQKKLQKSSVEFKAQSPSTAEEGGIRSHGADRVEEDRVTLHQLILQRIRQPFLTPPIPTSLFFKFRKYSWLCFVCLLVQITAISVALSQ